MVDRLTHRLIPFVPHDAGEDELLADQDGNILCRRLQTGGNVAKVLQCLIDFLNLCALVRVYVGPPLGPVHRGSPSVSRRRPRSATAGAAATAAAAAAGRRGGPEICSLLRK